MFRELVALKGDVEFLKTAFGNALKVGPVYAIDPAKGYRLRLGGTDDDPYLSPWYPHPETGKTSVPLKKGQIVGVVNPTGDPRQGFVIRGGYSDENPSPNDDMEANVFEDAGVRITVKAGALIIEVDGVTHRISGEGITTTGGLITHDGRNIGSTHVHADVTPGPDDTGLPH